MNYKAPSEGAGYDIIGDIHGYADQLTLLLDKLGYVEQDGVIQHPYRKAIFVGDWIDRGPEIRKTLAIVRSMIDEGHALGVLGNHEYNALTFHQLNPNGGHVRPHTIKNIHQHYQTLYQFRNHVAEWDDYLKWFLTIPLFLELPGLRVVHACWDESEIALLREYLPDGRLTPNRLVESAKKDSELWQAVEITLKGKEAALPDHAWFDDADGHRREVSRIRWWLKHDAETRYADYFFDAPPEIADLRVDWLNYSPGLTEIDNSKPIFFGHYWLTGQPRLANTLATCLDFSVAKGGVLSAYRWSGETELNPDHLVWV